MGERSIGSSAWCSVMPRRMAWGRGAQGAQHGALWCPRGMAWGRGAQRAQHGALWCPRGMAWGESHRELTMALCGALEGWHGERYTGSSVWCSVVP